MNITARNVLKKSVGNLFIAGFAVCFGSALSIVYLECIRLLSDSILKGNVNRIPMIFVVFSISLILSALILCIQNSKVLTVKQRLIESLEKNSIDIWLSVNYKNNISAEEMLPIIRNDIFTYSEQLSEFIIKITGTTVSVIFTSIYVIMIEPWLFVLTLLISIVAISISAYRGRKLPEQNQKLYFHMGSIYNHNAELVRNREVSYVLNGDRVIKPYLNEIEDYKGDHAKILGTMTMQRILGSANTLLNTGIVLVIGGYGVSKGNIEISDLIVLMAALGFLTNTLYQIPECISNYQQIKGLDSRIKSLITAENESADGTENIEKITSLSVENLSYAYNKGKNLFENLNFTLKSGECLILNGASGCGKSTLLKIFADILNNYSGNINCNGKILNLLQKNPFGTEFYI